MKLLHRIDITRLNHRLDKLAKIGAVNRNCICRLALTDEDKEARNLVVSWMKAAEMTVHIDEIGNIIAIRKGLENISPVMTGSHIDTVKSGGRFDGSYGILAGMEVVNTLNAVRCR